MRRYLIPIVLILVTLHQMVRVHPEGLSSWRGGGFGAYGGFHPRHNEAWILRKDNGEKRRYTKYAGTVDDYTARIRPCLTYTNERCVRAFLQSLPTEEARHLRVEIWQLAFDPHTLRLSRRLLLEVEGEGQP